MLVRLELFNVFEQDDLPKLVDVVPAGSVQAGRGMKDGAEGTQAMRPTY